MTIWAVIRTDVGRNTPTCIEALETRVAELVAEIAGLRALDGEEGSARFPPANAIAGPDQPRLCTTQKESQALLIGLKVTVVWC